MPFLLLFLLSSYCSFCWKNFCICKLCRKELRSYNSRPPPPPPGVNPGIWKRIVEKAPPPPGVSPGIWRKIVEKAKRKQANEKAQRDERARKIAQVAQAEKAKEARRKQYQAQTARRSCTFKLEDGMPKIT